MYSLAKVKQIIQEKEDKKQRKTELYQLNKKKLEDEQKRIRELIKISPEQGYYEYYVNKLNTYVDNYSSYPLEGVCVEIELGMIHEAAIERFKLDMSKEWKSCKDYTTEGGRYSAPHRYLLFSES